MAVDLSVVFKDHKEELNLTPFQKKIVTSIIQCQTPELGCHLIECSNSECTNEKIIFNSCKSNYCPKCQNYPQIKWAADRMEEVLPVEYMHIVFPVHTCLRTLIQYNPKRGLNALSLAVKKALNNTFGGKNNQIGVLSVIHTNTQLLNYAPHIHCLIPKGYLNSDKTKWLQIAKELKWFREKLSIQFKINLIKELNRLNNERIFCLPDDYIVNNVESVLEYAKKSRFTIQIQDNVKDIDHTLKYLGDKTKKVIIDDRKIVDYKDNIVTVSWSDRKDQSKIKEKEIDALLFLKRFILHILPPRFTRIRYYGFLSNSCKKKSIKLCKRLIIKANIKVRKIKSKVRENLLKLIEHITKPQLCPVCKKGFLILDGL